MKCARSPTVIKKMKNRGRSIRIIYKKFALIQWMSGSWVPTFMAE